MSTLDEICVGTTETYTYSGINNVSHWTVSSNLSIISSNATSITVAPIYSAGPGAAWVRANFEEQDRPCPEDGITFNLSIGQNLTGDINFGSTYLTLNTVNFISSNSFRVVMNAPGVFSYQWNLTSGKAYYTTASNGRVLNVTIQDGAYATFTVSATSDCGSITRTVTFINNKSWFKASPNPVVSEVLVKAIDPYSVSVANEEGSLSDLRIDPTMRAVKVVDSSTGEIRFLDEFTEQRKETTIDMSTYRSGSYFIEIISDQGRFIENIIKH
ncbi:MAG: hypothetical protein AAF990_27580 [Bacteroidota bacterium]